MEDSEVTTPKDSESQMLDIISSHYHATSTSSAILAERTHAAHNYSPLPIVISRASGTSVWNPEGQHFLDFQSAYSSLNHGHCHPELINAMVNQLQRVTLTSRAFHNDVFPKFAEKVTGMFGYDLVLPMNTGTEAVDTAIKIARAWAYKIKKVRKKRALVFSAENGYHGRTLGAISLSSDPFSRNNYEPILSNNGPVCPSTQKIIQYNNILDLEEALQIHGKDTAAFIIEPIQIEAGIVIPAPDYLSKAKLLCEKHNVLLICDEIQTGLGRTGKLLSSEWSSVKPDLVTLGKSLSGGMYPVSCVLGNKDVMLCIEPGTHSSTYGGNPLGCAVALRALELVEEENMLENAIAMGHLFREAVRNLDLPLIKEIKGVGLLNAIVFREEKVSERWIWEACVEMKEKGLLAARSNVHSPKIEDGLVRFVNENVIRFVPPLVVKREEIERAVEIIGEVVRGRMGWVD